MRRCLVVVMFLVAGAVRAGRRGSEQGHGRGSRGEDDDVGCAGARLRRELQGVGPTSEASRVRVDEGHSPRYAGAWLDEIWGEVSFIRVHPCLSVLVFAFR